MKILKKLLSVLLFLLILGWGTVTAADFVLCTQGKPPVFSVKRDATDVSLYHGLGYTITIGYPNAVGAAGAQVEGHFAWGWY